VSDPNLGKSVVEAYHFLTAIHNQLAQLLEALDVQMHEHRWKPTYKEVTTQVGTDLKCKRWMPDYLYRFYFPTTTENKSARIAGAIIFIHPPEGCVVPPLLGFAARFEAPQSHAEILSGWRGYAQGIATELNGKSEVQPVPYEVFKGFLPKATAFRGVALPVFDLTGAEVLRERVTNVLLCADTELGT
jgi:hypothetical protein